VIDNVCDGLDVLYPRSRGGRPRQFTLPERRQIKQSALALPTDLGQPSRARPRGRPLHLAAA
jgi:hypothetical protein